MKITKKYIALARKARACKESLAWLEAQPRTEAELREQHGGWFYWALVRLPLSPAVQERLAGDAEAEVRCKLADNPALLPALQERLAGDKEAEVRCCLARNPSVCEATQERLAADPDGWVRAYLARNPALVPAAQERLAGDKEPWVRRCLARNPAVYKETP